MTSTGVICFAWAMGAIFGSAITAVLMQGVC